jgi:hypothetical protein
MHRIVRVSLAVAALAFVVLASQTARAQSPCGWGGGGWGGGFGWATGYDWRANAQIIPYFSQHPPVYYSYPIPRPYGFSPYAALPGMIPAEMQFAPKPQEIVNPYFQPSDENKAPEAEAPEGQAQPPATTTGDRTARRMIVNPYRSVGR